MTIDNDKIKELCKKDLDAGFKMIMDTYQEMMYNHIRRLLVNHEDAQDALQDTFIQVYRNLPRFRFESSLATWIYRIATNECLKVLDKRKHSFQLESEQESDYLMNQLMAGEYIDYENELSIKFQQAILNLPEKQRLVFNLRYYDELEYEEIASILGAQVNTVKVNYHYAKEKIKEYILKH